jgi:hypothetical protein
MTNELVGLLDGFRTSFTNQENKTNVHTSTTSSSPISTPSSKSTSTASLGLIGGCGFLHIKLQIVKSDIKYCLHRFFFLNVLFTVKFLPFTRVVFFIQSEVP